MRRFEQGDTVEAERREQLTVFVTTPVAATYDLMPREESAHLAHAVRLLEPPRFEICYTQMDIGW